jgi:hemolysin activation/secretion protein
MSKKLSTITSILLLGTSLALAEVPTVGTVANPTNPAPSVKKDGLVINVDKMQAKINQELSNNQTVFIKSFNIEGNKVVSTSVLMSALKPFANKNLTMKEVNDAVMAVTNKYRENGYFAALAFVAPNAYNDGTLTISVTKGKIGNVKLENTSLVKDDTLAKIFDGLKGQDALSQTMEEKNALLSNLAGVKLEDTRISAGSQVGSIDVVLKTTATPRYDGYVTADNYGSKYTGIYKLGIGANINSPFGIGDKISIGAGTSDGGGTKNGSADYSAPLASRGIVLGVGASKSQYALGDTYSPLGATGVTSTVQARLSYPLISDASQTLKVSLNPQLQNIKDEQAGSANPRKANLVVFGADYSKSMNIFGASSMLSTKLNYTTGRLSFIDASSADIDAAGSNTKGGFSKLDCSTTVSSMLTSSITLKNVLNAQFAMSHKNLDSSQYITIGGSSGVRAFPTTQESASSGYIYTVELDYALPNINKYSQSTYLFYDAGRAFNADTTIVASTSTLLQDIGLGYRASLNKFFAKLELAHVVGGIQVSGVPYYNTKGLFQVGVEW